MEFFHGGLTTEMTFLLLSVMLLGGPVFSLKMHTIQLAGDKEYLRVQEPGDSMLKCRYDLAEDEQIRRVSWYHDDFAAFIWGPEEVPTVGDGLHKDDVVQTRSDGHLEFARLHPALAGRYRCEVTTSKRETYKSYEYQLLVIDMPTLPDRVNAKIESCILTFSWQAPPVSPKPSPKCGVYSAEHGFILTAANWMATPYYNGSIGYRLDEEEFHIRQMPLEAIIKCELGITKVDRTYIKLLEKSYNYTEIWERGCHPLETLHGVDLDYMNERWTCHSELVPKNYGSLKARVKCKDEFVAKYPDLVTEVDLTCGADLKWEVLGGLTWNHYDNLICVDQKDMPKPPPTSDHKPEMDLPPIKPVRGGDSSGGTWTSRLAIWLPLAVLSCLLLSGFICRNTRGIRKDPRRKE